jgi:site-specific DNA recombinase
MKKGAVLYIRVSTPEQALNNYSLPNQERKLRDYCKQHDLVVRRLFIERGDSARTDDRPEFQKMLVFCHQHRKEVSHVIVSDLSRLARNVLDQGQTIVELTKVRVQLVSVDEPHISETAAGRLAANIHGAFNQYFSDALSERTRERMQAAVKMGRFPWVAPLGYRNDTAAKNVIIDSESSVYVRKAFEMVASGQHASIDDILRLLTTLGFKTRRGRDVTKQTFARLLRNPFYAGWVVSGETRVRGNHEPLVSQDLFDRVQERLEGKTNGKTEHKKLNEDFPLKGFLRCAGCGRNLTAGWARGKSGQKFAYYWCWNRQCQNKTVVAREKVEWRYYQLLCMHESNASLLAQLPSLAAKTWAVRKESIAEAARLLSRRMSEQVTLNTRLIKAKLNGEITQADFEVMKKSIEAEMKKIEEEIKTVESERSTLEDLMKKKDEEPVNFGHAWRAGTLAQKIELQKVFYPDGLAYSLKNDFFEPQNKYLLQQFEALFRELLDVGVPDGI